MTIVRWSPAQQLASMEVDRLNRMLDPWRDQVRQGWVPPVDIYEDAGHQVVLRAELPEVKREDINVTVENDTLTLSGERKALERRPFPTDVKEEQFRRVERRYGAFSRSFTLPSTLDPSKISASYQDGVLTITVPPREDARPKQIQIETK